LRQVSHLKTSTPFTLIASGGIATGLEAAKAVALGADIVASARPMLVALHRGGKEGLRRFISAWMDGLRGAMFLTGSANLKDLQHAELVTPTPA
jgi:isopentenyl-diphosphate delta-isomerase